MASFAVGDTSPVVYGDDELAAIREVKAALIKSGIDESRIGARTLAVTTINSKLRIDESVQKYSTWLKALEQFGVNSLNDAEFKEEYAQYLRSYAACGKDFQGRSTFWIKGGAIMPEEEKCAVEAGIMYFMAIHADNVSLHQGITFVIDTSQQPATRIGNESKLQKAWSSFPLRPQRVYITGANQVKRFFINSLIKIAALFTKQKILDRIRFAEMEEVLKEVPHESVPVYVGGEGGGIQDLIEWVKFRLEQFPTPNV
jgi:hypothetical protein